MAYDPNSILPNLGAGQPSIAGIPRYGAGPGDLGMGDPRGVTGMPVSSTLGYPAMSPPSISMATPSPSPAMMNPPLPPHMAGRGGTSPTGPTGPSGPVPSTPVQGNPFFNFLSALFGHSGGSPQQGMTGLLNTPRGTDTLGNPLNRFG